MSEDVYTRTNDEVTASAVVEMTFNEPTDVLVTDPCYPFNNDDEKDSKAWQDFCELMHPGREDSPVARAGTMEVRGAKFLYSSTEYGDGSYPVETRFDQTGSSMGVDAGMVSIVPLADLVKAFPWYKPEEEAERGGVVIVRGLTGTVRSVGNGLRGAVDVVTDDEGEEGDDDGDEDEY